MTRPTEEQIHGRELAAVVDARRPTFKPTETSAKLLAIADWEKWRARRQSPLDPELVQPLNLAAAVMIEAAAALQSVRDHDGAGAAIYVARVVAAARLLAEHHLGDEIDRRARSLASGGAIHDARDRKVAPPFAMIEALTDALGKDTSR